jgi:flavodoxin
MIYFSLTGRTKQVAETIATELKQLDIKIESLTYNKTHKQYIADQNKIMEGDLSDFSYNLDVEDLGSYDLVFFGTPTHGARPAAAFNAYMERAKNVNGKKFVIFNTCRFLAGKTLNRMRVEIEKKQGEIVSSRTFKNFFKINLSKAKQFAEELNQEIFKSN